MNIIIVGDGKVGRALTEQLSREGHNLTVIDSDVSALEKSLELYDVMVLEGNGASLMVLREARADTADLFISATSSDEVNMLACIMAKKMGAKNTIARIRNPEYAEQVSLLQDELGFSMSINPELSTAKEIYNILQFPSFLHRDSIVKGKAEIVELKISEGSKLCGLPLRKLYRILSVKVLICAVERDSKAFIPGGDFVLCAGDKIHVTAESRKLAKVIHDFGLKPDKVKNTIIIGGSRIAYHLSKMLTASGIAVKIIEKNSKRCMELAAQLPEVMIIEGDGSNQRLLLQEGIENADAVVTLTSMDEENVFLSLYASHMGVLHVLTKVNQTEYADIVETVGIESVVSPRWICATEVAEYVRAMANAGDSSVVAMHELVDGKVQALEFRAGAGTKYLETELSEMPIKKNVLIVCIYRKGKAMIPDGKTRIKKGDNVVIVAAGREVFVDLNEIFTR